MQISLKLGNDPATIAAQETRAVAKVLTGAFKVGATLLNQRGRADIAAGGFGGKWQSNFQAKAYPKRGASLSPKIFAVHKIGYAGQFQDPETIAGKPFLWLPIEQNLPGGTHWTPKKFVAQFGRLRGGRRGAAKPLLFGQVAVGRNGKALKRKPRAGAEVRKRWLPVFVGVRNVRDPKRFDLVAVAQKVAAEIGDAVLKAL